MLDGMRRMSQGLVGRIIMGVVMGFISLSFAVWGVGNIFVGYGAGKVADVGGTEISVDSFRQLYQTHLQNMQRQARRAITNDQARSMGLDRQVLSQLVGDAALDNRIKALGLAMSNEETVKRIQLDPNFAGPGGKFDTNKFTEIMRDNGLTEAGFRDMQRKMYLRQEVAEAITGDMTVPAAALEAVNRFRNETRSIEYIELPGAAAGDIPPPDDATLQAYFDTRKQNFRAPEYRKIVTLTVTPTALANPAAVSDADAQALYDRVKGRFGTPAKRQVEQVVFPNEATAKEASEKIKAGASLADAATQLKAPMTDLGTVEKSDIFDKAIADATFALPEGATSDPIKGQFGYAITHVLTASPESVKPFADVAGELKTEIATERARKRASEIRDKVEDERTSGKPLLDAATAAGQKAVTIDAIDQSGRDKTGADVPGLTEKDALLKAAFASDIGVDNETLNTRDGGYVWFEVAGIDPARNQTLSEVRETVTAAWRDDEITRRLSEKAADLVKKIEGGESVEAIAKEFGLEAKSASDVRRVGTTSLPQGVIIRVFNLPVGQAGSAAGDGQSRVVFKILDTVTPELDKDSDVMKSVQTQLKQSYTEDLLTEYLAKLQTDVGVTVNQAALRAATGAADVGGDQ
jgi:peptidyl-prolyl cis-trans isomerase D